MLAPARQASSLCILALDAEFSTGATTRLNLATLEVNGLKAHRCLDLKRSGSASQQSLGALVISTLARDSAASWHLETLLDLIELISHPDTLSSATQRHRTASRQRQDIDDFLLVRDSLPDDSDVPLCDLREGSK